MPVEKRLFIIGGQPTLVSVLDTSPITEKQRQAAETFQQMQAAGTLVLEHPEQLESMQEAATRILVPAPTIAVEPIETIRGVDSGVPTVTTAPTVATTTTLPPPVAPQAPSTTTLSTAYQAYLQAGRLEEDFEPLAMEEFAERWGFGKGKELEEEKPKEEKEPEREPKEEPVELSKEEFEKWLKESSPELYRVYETEGYDVYKKVADELYQKRVAEFETRLKQSSPELYKIYIERGYEAYNKVLDEAQAKLAPYLDKEIEKYDLIAIARDIREGKLDREPANLLFGVQSMSKAIEAVVKREKAQVATITVTAELSPTEKFNELVKGGLIPEGSRFDRIDEEGNIWYYPPPEISEPLDFKALETEFLKETKSAQQIMIGQALYPSMPEYPALVGTKSYEELSEKDKEIVLADYSGRISEVETKWGTVSAPKWMSLDKEGLEASIGLVPVVGTIYFWDDMSPTWQAISIISDAAFIVTPLIPKIVSGVKGLVTSKEAVKVAQIAKSGGSETMAVLKRINKTLVSPFKSLIKAQAEYADDLVRVDKAGAAIMRQGATPSLAQSLVRANSRLQGSQVKLTQAARDYTSAIMRAGVQGFDDPTVLSAFNKMPEEIIRHTRAIVSAVLQPGIDIKAVAVELSRAKQALIVAKERWPLDPSKWTDLLQDISRLEAKLLAARIGDVSKLQQKLVTVREAISSLEARMLNARLMGKPPSSSVIKSLARARSQEATLVKQIDEAISIMEIDWGKGGFITRGGTATRIKPAPIISGGSGRPVQQVVPFISAVGVKGAKVTMPGEVSITPEPLVPPPGREPVFVPPHLQLMTVKTEPKVVPSPPEVEPEVEPKVWPIRPAIEPYKIPEVAPGVEPAKVVYPAPEVAPQVRTLTEPYVEPYLGTAQEARVRGTVEALIAGGVAPSAIPATLQSLGLAPMIAPSPVVGQKFERASFTPIPAPTPTPILGPTLPKTPVITQPQPKVTIRQPVEEGSITFAFGKRKGSKGVMVRQWYVIRPPWTSDKPESLSAPPLGAVNTESTSPYDTIQVIGRSREYGGVPESVSFDIGVTDGFITEYGRKIAFTGKGEETNVGERIPVATKGMSIPATGVDGSEFLDKFPGTPIQGISRRRMSKKESLRKTKRLYDNPLDTALSSMSNYP